MRHFKTKSCPVLWAWCWLSEDGIPKRRRQVGNSHAVLILGHKQDVMCMVWSDWSSPWWRLRSRARGALSLWVTQYACTFEMRLRFHSYLFLLPTFLTPFAQFVICRFSSFPAREYNCHSGQVGTSRALDSVLLSRWSLLTLEKCFSALFTVNRAVGTLLGFWKPGEPQLEAMDENIHTSHGLHC